MNTASVVDINDPKVRWAQHLANVMQEDQVIIKNLFNGYDIKRASAVVLVNNPEVVAIIEPLSSRSARHLDDVSDIVSDTRICTA